MSYYWKETIFDTTGKLPPYQVELGPGRGQKYPEILYIGYTREADPDCDIYHDLNTGIPLPDETVAYIYSNQVLEHISQIIHLFNEMYRVLLPDGTMKHCVPHYRSPWAWGDPTHVRAFSERSFEYFSTFDGKPWTEQFSNYGITCTFEIINQVVRPELDITVEMRKI